MRWPEEEDDEWVRILKGNGGAGLKLGSPGMITWYCLIIAVSVPVCCCSLYLWYMKCRSYQRAQRTLEDERRIEAVSRIEANVQVFSEAEKQWRVKAVRASVRKFVKRLTDADFKKDVQKEEGASTPEGSISDTDHTCSICLEEFKSGDLYAHASNAVCRHAFHEECIVSWLSTQHNGLCPCCRQPFACLYSHTSVTSATTHERLSNVFDLESRRCLSVAADVDIEYVESHRDMEAGDMEETNQDGVAADTRCS